jgi:hypothetical protein
LKKYITILLGLTFSLLTFSQRVPLTRTEIKNKGIKTITYKQYTTWNRDSQVVVKEGILEYTNVEYFDTMGVMFRRTNQNPGMEITEFMYYAGVPLFDKFNNLRDESYLEKLIVKGKEFEFKFDNMGRLMSSTSFNYNRKPHQIVKFYYEDNKLLKDSSFQEGEALFVTNFIYENGRLIRKVTDWAKKVPYQNTSTIDFTFDKNGLVVKVLTKSNHSANDAIESNWITINKYNTYGQLLWTKSKGGLEGEKNYEEERYIYDANGNVIKIIETRRVRDGRRKSPKKKRNYSTYKILEYSYY